MVQVLKETKADCNQKFKGKVWGKKFKFLNLLKKRLR